MGGIVFFVMLTAFVIYKLFSILGYVGSRNDIEESKMRFMNSCCGQQYDNNNIHTPKARTIEAVVVPESEVRLPEEIQKKFHEIRLMDGSFEYGKFVDGVKRAYDVICNAIYKRDEVTLSEVVSERIMSDVAVAWGEAQNMMYEKGTRNWVMGRKGLMYMLDVVLKCTDIELLEVHLNGRLVTISLRIQGLGTISENSNVKKRIVEERITDNLMGSGDESLRAITNVVNDDGEQTNSVIENVSDWTFSRHMSMTNAMWQVVKITDTVK